jgi:hypothetical protein
MIFYQTIQTGAAATYRVSSKMLQIVSALTARAALTSARWCTSDLICGVPARGDVPRSST